MARHSMVFWTASDQGNLSVAVRQMLEAILTGLNNEECKYVRFRFCESKSCNLQGKARFYKAGRPGTPIAFSGLEILQPRDAMYLYSEGVSARVAMDLLEAEVSKLCFAMTRGQMISSGGSYSETHTGGGPIGPWIILFCKEGSEVAVRISQERLPREVAATEVEEERNRRRDADSYHE